jgi:hypothetical protein
VDESGPDTKASESAMVVMDQLSQDRNLKERGMVGGCGKAVDGQGCDLGRQNGLVGSIGRAVIGRNLNMGSCGRAVGGWGVSWKLPLQNVRRRKVQRRKVR